MKKLLAIILSVICLFSCCALPASAGNIIGDVVGDILDVEMEEEHFIYGIIYEMQIFEDITLIYKPMATLGFESPGTYIISKDTPLAIDHAFVCWTDNSGNFYYVGDPVYVEGQITLYAVWKEKEDDDSRLIRVIKTTIDSLKRIFQKFLGIFDTSVEFYEDYHSNITETPDEITLDLPVKYAVYEDGRIKVCIDTPSLGIDVNAPTGTLNILLNDTAADYDYYFSEMTDGEGCKILLVNIGELEAGTAITFTLPANLLAGVKDIKGYKSVDGKWVYQTIAQSQSTNAYDVEIAVE